MDAPFWYVSLDEMGNFMYYKNRDPGRRETDHGPGIKAMCFIKSIKEKGSIMRKVILDVDTGTDDAIAIMCAIQAEELDVLAVCTVNGNRGVSYTTENTLRLLEYLGREEIPVYRGCALPMVSTLPKWRRPEIPFGGYEFKAQEVHGDYLDLPHSQNKKAEEMDAVSYYIKTLTETKEKITLVPVGPLTNLAVALRAERILKEMGCEVYMIRTDDTFVDIHDRASMANKKDTDIFVSVHSNAFPSNANVHGTLTYYCPGSRRGKTLAQCLQTAVSASAGSQDRGIAQDELVVVKETSMPAALVELGFMTNHEELMRLADPVYQEKLAQGIAAGIEDYLLNKR